MQRRTAGAVARCLFDAVESFRGRNQVMRLHFTAFLFTRRGPGLVADACGTGGGYILKPLLHGLQRRVGYGTFPKYRVPSETRRKASRTASYSKFKGRRGEDRRPFLLPEGNIWGHALALCTNCRRCVRPSNGLFVLRL